MTERERLCQMLILPWKRGPVAQSTNEVVVSATRTEIHRWRDLPGILIAGQGLRRRWPRQPGAIGLRVGLQPIRRVSWTMSIWHSQHDLDNFIRSAHHLAALTPYRDHVDVNAVIWSDDPERATNCGPPHASASLHNPPPPRRRRKHDQTCVIHQVDPYCISKTELEVACRAETFSSRGRAGGETRTLTGRDLNAVPLPIGLRRRSRQRIGRRISPSSV